MKKVINEIKNITWISKRSVAANTLLVILCTIVLGTYIYGVDSLTDFISQLIINKF